jgi:hypothetical protein
LSSSTWFCLDGLRESDEAVLKVETADDADLEVEAGVDDVSSKPDEVIERVNQKHKPKPFAKTNLYC